VPVPAVGANESLRSVSGVSSTDAWAVGSAGPSGGHALVLHWNGKAWSRVPVPVLAGTSSGLYAVKVLSPANAWAVGSVSSDYIPAGLILHWNGISWKRVSSPSPVWGKYGDALWGVTATSAASVWAVGCTDGCFNLGNPQIERWNGASSKQNSAPVTPYANYALSGVAATSASNVWAVGGGGPVTSESAAIAHWNGRAWKLFPGIHGALLAGVAAISPDNASTVGSTVSGGPTSHILILHWNGKAWTRES
jgi:hypothetical protein